MKIAIIGSGISGLTCAYYLHREHRVHVFESADRIGGHTATVDVVVGGRRYAIDTGFIVYNDRTYPNFIRLLDELRVPSKPTEMGFSLTDSESGLEYSGANLNTLFAQRKNLLSPAFLGMLRDIMRFNREAYVDVDSGSVAAETTLADYLEHRNYGRAFRDYYLLPMGSAIWSADMADMMDFPVHFFVRFFHNHGLLSIGDRPQWRVIEGGSREYIAPLCAGFRDNIRLNCPVAGVRRLTDGVEIALDQGRREYFDHVIFACHSDQALQLIRDPRRAETEVLGALPYRRNDVVLHTDVRLLPRNQRTWSSWNYLRSGSKQRATLTYNMNILQGLTAPEVFCVTLNAAERINPHKILGHFSYDHPVFTLDGLRAQQRWGEISVGRTSFCGAYWHNGFHEDGVASALRVVGQVQSDGVRRMAAGSPSVGTAA